MHRYGQSFLRQRYGDAICAKTSYSHDTNEYRTTFAENIAPEAEITAYIEGFQACVRMVIE